MILKTFELSKIKDETIFYLLYGKNDGLKSECIDKILNKSIGKVYNYDEKQIKDEIETFYENILSGSLFEDSKIIIINRATDKIYEIIQDLIDRKIHNIKIIINAGLLETRSKIRSLFEKQKDLICIPTYQDNNDTLSKLATIFFRDEKILISQQNINLIIEKKLSVRQTENFVKIFKKKKGSNVKFNDPNIQNLERSISDKIGLNVSIKNNKKNKGTITFVYHDIDQLNKIIDIIKSNY